MKEIKYTVLYCVCQNFCDYILLQFRVPVQLRKRVTVPSYDPGSATLPITPAAGMRLTTRFASVYLDAPLLDSWAALGDGVRHLVRHLRGPELRYQRAETPVLGNSSPSEMREVFYPGRFCNDFIKKLFFEK
jgi:hypothetical protein